MNFIRQNRDLIIKKAIDGVPPRDIARALGVERMQVSNLLAYERRNGRAIPHFNTGGRVLDPRISVPRTILHALEGPAAARHLTERELAAELLDALAAEPKLIDAILDDGVTS